MTVTVTISAPISTQGDGEDVITPFSKIGSTWVEGVGCGVYWGSSPIRKRPPPGDPPRTLDRGLR